MNAHDMQKYCVSIQNTLWNNVQADNLCGAAADIVEEIAAGNFNRDNIRTQPFTEKVIAACKKASAQ